MPMARAVVALLALVSRAAARREYRKMAADFNDTMTQAPPEYIESLPDTLPRSFTWAAVKLHPGGPPMNLLTRNLNQHIPQCACC